MGKVTAGIAAKIAGVDRLTFLSLLSRYGVPAINLRGDEVSGEIEAAKELIGS
jgi:predicted HTH domain antitoxin